MSYCIGDHRFKCIEVYQALLGIHAIATYDVSPEAREKHDMEARIKRDMQPSCMEKKANYLGDWEWAWAGGFKNVKPKAEPRAIGPDEKVPNIWIK